ncbi:hypothetical protein G8S21_10455 [Clostridium botulinum C]|uniref:hypothetical protein n=1 Tax=Clostridium TaxID=1485 RepID=UPI000EA081C7|nr:MULTISPECIES: hypothetical protein [Clostridium]AYF55425.1 hypothetical protein DFH04_11920 [Clostridium novyi]MCD3246357.1 hypothetical protein [Clostridium botulinum C]MCD3262720.1 hypothetical protein [Clostridium botulinum C]
MILSKNNTITKENKLQQNICNICNGDYKYFLNKRNVVGLGLGYKVKNGFYTNQLCLQVFVSRKYSENEINIKDKIPSMYKGILTDVKETGYFKACSLNKKIRPVLGGYSISVYKGNEIYGTAGCVVTNGVNKFVLSTNHVLTKINKLYMHFPIIQPACVYGGTYSDTIATLHRYIPLHLFNGGEPPINLTDCALGLLTNANIMNPEIAFIGKVTCVKSPKLGIPVRKVGAMSELTEGIITSINANHTVTYTNGEVAFFKDQILTSNMAVKGDSGSILIDKNNCAIGLLFATTNNFTAYNRLTTVLDQLDVCLTN